MNPQQRIAHALGIDSKKVAAAVSLFDEGATVPFIARYRKERTGGLDEVQLRAIEEVQRRFRDLDERRNAIKKALVEQGKLSPGLSAKLDACLRKAELDDLYAPYKSKRKTRADKAREAGLGGLAAKILAQPRNGHPMQEARRFIRRDRGIEDADAALQGARDIVAEELAQDPERRAWVRETVKRHGRVQTKLVKDHPDGPQFRDYASYTESASRIPSHRYLAVCRGEAQGALRVKLRPDMDRTLEQLLRGMKYFARSPYGPQLEQAASDALKRLLMPAAERAVRAELKAASDADAIDVFQKNLEALLLAAPLGAKRVLGVDPGIRTGCKWAMVGADGGLAKHGVVQVRGSNGGDAKDWRRVLEATRPEAVAVGNGTGGREAEASVRRAVKDAGLDGRCVVVSVNEAGASVYSASELAGRELGQVDLTVRGAVSIARRLQDPLAELVKIPPKSIGVGQYQHDVDQGLLQRRLGYVVESCVNRVGVDVTTASPSLLALVAGVGPKTAEAIVAQRRSRTGLKRRKDLLKVAGLGPKTYEQCAGFLRVPTSEQPLDASAVHPERYPLVTRMARDLGVDVATLVGDAAQVSRIDWRRYEGDGVGRATLTDIREELAKPGRDPRDSFEAPRFDESVQDINDLEPGMVLEGVVTNVTNFGAFVDIGVHQDGLVHISQLADRFVSSPHDVARAGQRLTVKVLEVDHKRRRISLTAKPSAL